MDLLERDALLDALDARLAAAAAGSGSLVLVAGEAGVGKSTLAAAFCARHELDAAAWWGGCDGMRTARPLGPLHDIARAAGEPLAGLMASDATRHEIFATFLDSLCTNGAPVIVTVEDVHWADEATLDLLVFLGRRVGRTRAVVLATYRDDEAYPHHPLRTALGHLATTAGVHRLTVAPLSREAVSSLAATRQAAADADRVFEVTGGNPFFVTEILAVPAGTVPPTVSDAVLARISRLSPSARAAMDAASLVPNQIEVSLLRQCVVDDSAIDDCQRAGILFGDGTALRFRHELLASPWNRPCRRHGEQTSTRESCGICWAGPGSTRPGWHTTRTRLATAPPFSRSRRLPPPGRRRSARIARLRRTTPGPFVTAAGNRRRYGRSYPSRSARSAQVPASSERR